MLSIHLSAAEIAAALPRGRRCGAGWVACCPGHEDRDPSLSLRDSLDGIVLVHCHAGCSQSDVIAALRAKGLWLEHARRWLTPLEWAEQQRYRAGMRERERQAAYFYLALEPLLLEAIEGLRAVETLDWDDDDQERFALTKELALVRAAREHPARQVALYIEWLTHAPKLAEAICAAGIERRLRIQLRIWRWISAQH